jgi:glycosyltransferase involved in cell wall biosynthesis
MRIAMFSETFVPHTDGVVTRLKHTLAELHAAGDEMLVIAPRARGLPAEYCGARVVAAPSLGLFAYKGFRVGLPVTSALDEPLAAFAPDVLHVVNPAVLGLAALSYANRASLPLVASYHTNLAVYARRYSVGMLEPLIWRYVRYLHNGAHLNLCTSRPVLSMLRERGFQRLALWEPGVDADLFSPRKRTSAWRARLMDGGSQPRETTLFLYVGRLAKEKNLESLAPALSQLAGCHLALVGEGPAEATLRRAFAGLPVTFAGPLFGEELAAAYAAADIFVFPSPTETWGLAAIEAMAAGLPVVGARRGGIPDIVREGETGLLFDPDTPGDLERALGALVGDVAERERQGRAARARAESWSWAAATAGLRRYYRSLLVATRGALPEPETGMAAETDSIPDMPADSPLGTQTSTPTSATGTDYPSASGATPSA